MPSRCQGFGRPLRSERLEQCVYDSAPGDEYCSFHRKVVDGLITDLVNSVWEPDGRRRRKQLVSLSWQPGRSAQPRQLSPEELMAQEIEVVRREWGLG